MSEKSSLVKRGLQCACLVSYDVPWPHEGYLDSDFTGVKWFLKRQPEKLPSHQEIEGL